MLDLINSNLISFWFIVGFSLLAIEILAFGFGSGVLLFGSLGALIAGALMWFGVAPQTWLAGIGVFAVASAVSTAVLWVPLKKLQNGPELGNDRSSDLIGHAFRLTTDVARGAPGSTRYSGIDWRVEVSEESTLDNLYAGSLVNVASVEAGIFHVVAAADTTSE